MTLSIWRYAHLVLAIISFLFLTMASVTGVILALEPITQKTNPYKVENFNQLTIAQTIPVLKDLYPELSELSIDKNQFVTLEGFDEDGNDFKYYINPTTGEKIGDPLPKNEFFEWVKSLHRSLFLHETGRFIVGIMSFLLLLIAVSGTILIVKHQQGIRHFFSKINKDYFAQYFHVAGGRLLLIPITIIALTGTYLFLLRFEVIKNPAIELAEITNATDENPKNLTAKDFEIFKTTKLSEVTKLEFPLFEDTEEFYKLKTTKGEYIINQFNGKTESQSPYSTATILEDLSLDLHTGRTNSVWAVILAIASINILFFIWSGFVITFKRAKTKVGKNEFDANEAEIILLVGSENGSTLGFVNKIKAQLLSHHHKVFLAQLNQYQVYKNAQQIIVFTSTYGIGDAPTNAKKFEQLVQQIKQPNPIKFTVVGFGSRAYTEYCGYAIKVDQWLAKQSWATRLLDLKTVNDKSPEEFTNWVNAYKEKTDIPLATTPAMYIEKTPRLKPIKVIAIKQVEKDDNTFTVTLKPNQKFKSGDLLAIYPANDHRERLYSIGKVNGNLQLVVKLHEFGLGSQYLHHLKAGETIKARIVKNKAFYVPTNAKQIILIANGTGIAPFLGMIDENISATKMHLYAGFRYHNHITKSYETFAETQIKQNKLTKVNFAFSREQQKEYVMDLILRDQDFIAEALKNGSVIMVCGALAMQHDIEKVLTQICNEKLNQSFESFKSNGQFLTDCY